MLLFMLNWSSIYGFYPKAARIHPSAVISPEAKLGNNVSVGANAVIESGVELGDDAVIGAGCFVGKQ